MSKKQSLRTSSVFLEYIKITSFGKFANTIVGPFKSGLNVVYGPNESGKTTITELIRGVLFGWPQNRKQTNSYIPEAADRVGSLFFRNPATKETVELKRAKNTEEQNDELHVLDDIDKDTFNTMFALTSDELNRLDKHNEVTAHLLTAGSGTSTSPAHALENIQGRIKDMMSRSAQNPQSIANLRVRQDVLRQEIQEGLAEAEHFRDQEQKLRQLTPRKETLLETQKQLNSEIESLKAKRGKLEQLDAQQHQLEEQLEQAQQEWDILSFATDEEVDSEVQALSQLSSSESYHLRDVIEDFEEQRRKLEQRSEHAKNAAVKSQSEFEVLMEDRDVQADQRRARTQRVVQMALSIIIPALMVALSIYIVFLGQQRLSLSYTVLGFAVILGALIIAAAGIVMNLRPSKLEEALNERRKKVEWVMQQDRKAYEATQAEEAEYLQKVTAFLESHQLTHAQGSLRRARALLDLAKDYRSQLDLREQNKKALTMQQDALCASRETLIAQRKELYKSLGLAQDASPQDVEALIIRKEEERTSIMQLSSDTNRQFGEITHELQQAQYLSRFDEVKLEYELVQSQLQAAYQDLARLLLAQRSLEVAIAQWEKKSQPEVYAQASRLLALMTNGVWQQVRMNAAGEIEVVDAIKTVRPPHLLSLGTRQQLYLSLRIALLMMATNTGKALPVLCDDILVNFDQKRREGAIRALLELAQYRQVIVFTCHPEIAELIKSVDSDVNSIEL